MYPPIWEEKVIIALIRLVRLNWREVYCRKLTVSSWEICLVVYVHERYVQYITGFLTYTQNDLKSRIRKLDGSTNSQTGNHQVACPFYSFCTVCYTRHKSKSDNSKTLPHGHAGNLPESEFMSQIDFGASHSAQLKWLWLQKV